MSYNGFIKLHDHMKIFGGYFRFIAILGLGAARAAFYGLQPVDSVLEPFFNSSATWRTDAARFPRLRGVSGQGFWIWLLGAWALVRQLMRYNELKA